LLTDKHGVAYRYAASERFTIHPAIFEMRGDGRKCYHIVCIAPWVALVVGVHFWPLAPLLRYPLLYGVATLVSIAALVAVPLARAQTVTVSAVTGLATGLILLAAALYSLGTVLSP